MVLLIITLFVVGGRRLENLRYLAHDPVIARFCGLARIPADRTVIAWLKRFTQAALQAVITLNSDLLYEQIERLRLSPLTSDVDGTVVWTGGTVAWAFRGINPHHRKDPSYYPLLAHLAQTGQILRLRNRPGTVHDSQGAVPFLRDLPQELPTRFGRGLPLEWRMEAAFFQRELRKEEKDTGSAPTWCSPHRIPPTPTSAGPPPEPARTKHNDSVDALEREGVP